MNHSNPSLDDTIVEVKYADAASPFVVVCEHASAFIPPEFDHLGLAVADRESHVVWDPGAGELATRLAEQLFATLVTSNISRLVYDCNRPPDAHDAIPERSETVDIPGNVDLTPDEIAERAKRFYEPFRKTLANVLQSKTNPVLVTVHSFTPIYFGKRREIEIGVLHDTDTRLADELLADLSGLSSMVVRRNEPYGPDDGVTHTLKEHAISDGHLNVMLEVRNDLLFDVSARSEMAVLLAGWLIRALEKIVVGACKV